MGTKGGLKCLICASRISLVDSIAFSCKGCKNVLCANCRKEHACAKLNATELKEKQQFLDSLQNNKTESAKLEKL